MGQKITADSKGEVYFIHDGGCPICHYAAYALRIRQSVGPLYIIDARSEPGHPLMKEIEARGLDLDEGMVMKFGDHYYHGADVLVMMALLGSGNGWFNRANALLFRSKMMATCCYPFMRAGRNLLIRLKGIPKLRNLEKARVPIFKAIFGEAWEQMPPVLHRHYANRPYSHDVVSSEGIMEVRMSGPMRVLSLFMRLVGALVPYTGTNIPATVRFRSEADSNAYCFDREFHFPGKKPYRFFSRMIPVGGNEMIEYMSLGLGWHGSYRYENGKVLLTHLGYVWQLGPWRIPLPLNWIMGRVHAEEEAIDDQRFRMHMDIIHPWFGTVYSYGGVFAITGVALDD